MLPVRLALLLIVASVAACSQTQMLDRVSTAQERAVAERAIQGIQRADATDLDGIVDAGLRQELRSAIPALQQQLADNGTLKLVDARFETQFGQPSVRTTELTYSVDSPDEHSAVLVVLRTIGNEKPVVIGMHAQQLKEQVGWYSGFGLFGKSVAHYLMLATVAAALIVTVASVIRVWRSGRFKRRWIWTIGCLIGVGQLSIDWATGQLSFNPIFLKLLSASVMKPSLFASWFVAVGLPIVALYVLMARRGPADVAAEEASA